jgi:putative cobalt transporter subunit CbtA
MKTLIFFVITLASGTIGGLFLGLINQLVTEPYIDKAVGIEVQRDIATGDNNFNATQLAQYRIWQKSGELVAATILGTSLGALFGIIFAYSRKSLPSSSNVNNALLLAGIMWFVLFMMTALKYPPNPPSVGNPDTIYYRQTLYIMFISVSGLSALGAALIYRKLGKVSNNQKLLKARNIVAPLIYAVIMIVVYVDMPSNPDVIYTSMDLVTNFRIASVFTMGAYWGIMSFVFGMLWEKFKPHEGETPRTLRPL